MDAKSNLDNGFFFYTAAIISKIAFAVCVKVRCDDT